MWEGCYKWNQFKSKHVERITDDCESCQNEISTITTRVNIARGQGGDLHEPIAHENHTPWLSVKSPPLTLVVHPDFWHLDTFQEKVCCSFKSYYCIFLIVALLDLWDLGSSNCISYLYNVYQMYTNHYNSCEPREPSHPFYKTCGWLLHGQWWVGYG